MGRVRRVKLPVNMGAFERNQRLGKGSDFYLETLFLRIIDDCFDSFGRIVLNPIGAALTADCSRHLTNHNDTKGRGPL